MNANWYQGYAPASGGVGGGVLFNARGTAAFNNHAINATALPQNADLYNRLDSTNTRGVVSHVGGAYVALNDAANDRNIGAANNPSAQALLQTARQLERQATTPIEQLSVQSARLGLAETGCTQRNVWPGSAEGDALLGAMTEAAFNGLPGEGTQGVGPRPTQSSLAGVTSSELPRTTGNRVNSPARVTAEAEVNGEVFRDTNPAHRPPVVADASEPTLIADRSLARDVQRGQPTPNANMADAHAEIGAMQQAYAAGRTTGANKNIVGRVVLVLQ